MTEARAVIDATGTWRNPNPQILQVRLQSEKGLADHIKYGIPDINTNTKRYSNKKIVVIGSGHSDINTLLALAELQTENPAIKLVWICVKKLEKKPLVAKKKMH